MKTMDLSEVVALAVHVQPGSDEPVILTDHGRAVAAVVPVTDDDVDDLTLSIHPTFQAILEKSERRLHTEGGLPSREVRQRLGLPAEPS